jgi:hypothetical protein
MKIPKSEPDLLPVYDFSNSRRSPYAKRYALGTNVVILEPDVAQHFPDAERVNEALRLLIRENLIKGPAKNRRSEKQGTLDVRHRDVSGEIRTKRGDTLISTIRKDYPGFAPDVRGDMKLETFLYRKGFASLSEALKNRKRKSGAPKR